MKRIISLLAFFIACVFVANAQNDAGVMKIYKNGSVIAKYRVSQIEKIDFEQKGDNEGKVGEPVDLGLSVFWASWNVGASASSEDGGYYAWGGTQEKEDYNWLTYKWGNAEEGGLTKYCLDSQSGTLDNKTTLDLEDDVAHVKWGGDWRMPTQEEWNELIKNCQEEFGYTEDGVFGVKYTASNGNSIFLPATGYCQGADFTACGSGSFYWSSTLGYTSGAIYNYGGVASRCWGLPVRPVMVNKNYEEPEETYVAVATGVYTHAVSASIYSNAFGQELSAFFT